MAKQEVIKSDYSYVVVELKTVKFEPEFAGKLNFYVTAADRQLRGKDDNTTWQNRR